jgi:hypothetical protein
MEVEHRATHQFAEAVSTIQIVLLQRISIPKSYITCYATIKGVDLNFIFSKSEGVVCQYWKQARHSSAIASSAN